MAGALEQIIEKAIEAKVDRLQIKQILTGTVVKVGETACEVARDNAPALYDVRLNAVDGNLGSYITVYPAQGSFVIVGIIENLKTEAVVLRCSEIERISVKIDNMTMNMDKNEVVFNQGDNNGLIKIAEMIDWMSKVYSDLKTLQIQLSTHPVAGNGEVLGLAFNPVTPSPDQNTFEDIKVRH